MLHRDRVLPVVRKKNFKIRLGWIEMYLQDTLTPNKRSFFCHLSC